MYPPFCFRPDESKENEKYHCQVIRVVDGNKLWIMIDPPLSAILKKEGYIEIEDFVLSPAYVEDDLVPEVTQWPCNVLLCMPHIGMNIDEGPYWVFQRGWIEREDIERRENKYLIIYHKRRKDPNIFPDPNI